MKFILIVLSAGFLIATAEGTAYADDPPFGSLCNENPYAPGTNVAPCFADDANMDYCTPSTYPAAYGNIFVAAMANLDSQTQMYDTYQPTCGTQTDIGGYLNTSPEVNLTGTAIRGIALCTKPLGGWGSTRCDQGSLVINTSLVSGTQARKTLCHEIGHFTGLYHYSGTSYSCMVSGSSTTITYSPSEVSLINAKY
ncbi:hypothetical protein ACFUTX_16400 [Microbacterium sp. NPDC057407]|uniref:hypothetical protein n=1 Tax=Microbacterium sp. NPDC057407 TaxID=3346120 RepID=UPI00366F49D3